MSPKNDTKVLIGGNVYTLSGDESEEYIQRVALYINNKLDDLKSLANGQLLNTRLMSILLAINIADDFFKEKEKVSELSKELEMKNQKIAELEQDIKNIVIEIEKLENEKIDFNQRIKDLENEILNYKAEIDEYIETFDIEKG